MATVRFTGGGSCPDAGASGYVRRRPENTLLYRLVEQHYRAFEARLAAEGGALPRYVAREFEDFLACGRLEHGFLRGSGRDAPPWPARRAAPCPTAA